MKYTKVFYLSRHQLHVILTLPKDTIVWIWADESVEFEDGDMRREFELRIVPLIEAGQRSGETGLRRVRWKEHSPECGDVREEGIGNPTFAWKASEPWWSPNNEKWWETPFCARLEVA